MITLQEAIDIAQELQTIRSSKPIYSAGGWNINSRTKDMMDFYNTNRKQLSVPDNWKDGFLIPFSMNCNPCIGKVVQVLLSQKLQTS